MEIGRQPATVTTQKESKNSLGDREVNESSDIWEVKLTGSGH